MVIIKRTYSRTVHEVRATANGRILEIENEIELWNGNKLEIIIINRGVGK